MAPPAAAPAPGPSTGGGSWTRSPRAELLALAAALALRALYLWQMRGAPVFRYAYGDGRAYDAWAQSILAGDWLGTGVYFQAPLYPYFLAAVHALLGPGLPAVRLAQALLGALACALLVRAGRDFFTPAAGLAAGLLLACYPAAVFFDGLVQKSALDAFFMALLLAVLGGIHRADRPWRWLAAGLTLGLFALTRENALVLLAAVAAWLAVRERATPRRGLLRAALLLGGWAALLLPVGLRNLAVGGEFHLTTSQFGPAFYVGNNPNADGLATPYVLSDGSSRGERAELTALAERAVGRALTPGEVSRHWRDRALGFIAESPGRWLALLGRKWLLFWNRAELADTDDQRTYGEWSPALRVLDRLFHFGVLLPLAAAGLALTARRWRELWVLCAAALLYAGSVALFAIFARYRHPVVPILALFAGAALVEGFAAWRRRDWRRLAAPALAGLAAALLAHLPIAPRRSGSPRAVLFVNLGAAAWNAEKDAARAQAFFHEAIRDSPRYPEPYKDLGTVLRAERRWGEALDWYRRALALEPGDAKTLEGMGVCATNLGRPAEALDWFRRALAIDPRLADAHRGLGLNLERLGFADEARRHHAEAARLDPAYAGPQR